MTNHREYVQQLFQEGSELLRQGNFIAALSCFEQANEIAPSNAIIFLHAGAALHNLTRYEEALACYDAAIRLAPHLGEAHNNRGNSLMTLGRFKEAANSFSQAARLLPSSPVPLTARASALQALGLVSEAETDCRMALKIAPEFAQAHWNLALNLLLQGNYSEGWLEYEWRWNKADFTSPRRHTDIPIWDGSELHGRTILLHAEQGFGDTIQFVRYIQLVVQQGGSVVLECHPQLVSLLKEIEGVLAVVPFDSPVPQSGFQLPLLSLPHIFKTTLENIPSKVPYITVPTAYRDKWTSLIQCHPDNLRIGLVWAGKNYPDPLRSCRLLDLAHLATEEKITFFSLQVGAGSEECKTPPIGMQLIDLTSQIHDFADTAALINQLDLVVSIDTAVAHLAGALGKPVCLLLPFAPDWRWLLKRNNSPWYPSMRLFRQAQPTDWGPPIENLKTYISETWLQT